MSLPYICHDIAAQFPLLKMFQFYKFVPFVQLVTNETTDYTDQIKGQTCLCFQVKSTHRTLSVGTL